jgi:hypothetical protein
MSDSVLLPVGRPGGQFDEPGSTFGLVRFGGALGRLDAQSYRLWRVAAAVRGEADLLEWARPHGIDEVDATITSLRERGLIVTVPLDRAFASSHTVHLIGELLGSHPDGPRHGFVVEGRSGQTLGVGAAVYEALLRCGPYTSIAAVGALLAATFPETDAVAAILEALPALVRTEVVLVDVTSL